VAPYFLVLLHRVSQVSGFFFVGVFSVESYILIARLKFPRFSHTVYSSVATSTLLRIRPVHFIICKMPLLSNLSIIIFVDLVTKFTVNEPLC
jgi:hypothetical protein